MKIIKAILALFLVYGTATLHAQEKFGTYTSSGLNHSYDIAIAPDTKDKAKYTLYIDAYSLDKLYTKGGIMVNEQQQSDLVTALKAAKAKYEEWVNTAKTNNVTDLDKTMEISTIVGGYFKMGDWKFQHRVKLTFSFEILSTNSITAYYLQITTGKLTASDNEFMKTDGLVIFLYSSKEIQDFIDDISTEKITAYLSKPKAGDLFK